MPKVAGFEVTVWKGYVPTYAAAIREVERDGADGVGLVSAGFRTETTTIATGVRVDAGEVADVLAGYRRLQWPIGGPIDVVDQFGETSTGVVVQRVQTQRYVQPDDTVWIDAVWTLTFPVKKDAVP